MTQLYVIRPTGDVLVDGGITITGAATASAAYADESDATYTFGHSHDRAIVQLADPPAVSKGNAVVGIQLRLRASDPFFGTANAGFSVAVALSLANGSQLPFALTEAMYPPLTQVPTDIASVLMVARPAGGLFSIGDLYGMVATVFHDTGATATGGNVYRFELDIYASNRMVWRDHPRSLRPASRSSRSR